MLATRASKAYGAAFLANCTLYSSAELRYVFGRDL